MNKSFWEFCTQLLLGHIHLIEATATWGCRAEAGWQLPTSYPSVVCGWLQGRQRLWSKWSILENIIRKPETKYLRCFKSQIPIKKLFIYFAVIIEVWKTNAKFFMKFHKSQNKQDFKTETSLRIAAFVQISTIICLIWSFCDEQYISLTSTQVCIYYRPHELQNRSWFSLKFLDDFSVSDHCVYKGCWFHPITSDLWSFFSFSFSNFCE